jgi:hypothetical protein
MVYPKKIVNLTPTNTEKFEIIPDDQVINHWTYVNTFDNVCRVSAYVYNYQLNNFGYEKHVSSH